MAAAAGSNVKVGSQNIHWAESGAFTGEISAEMLREGIEIKPAGEEQIGIRARLTGEDVEVDMTDKVIFDALIRHLLPRFRYIVQGIQESE